jgi:hypothetical protein
LNGAFEREGVEPRFHFFQLGFLLFAHLCAGRRSCRESQACRKAVADKAPTPIYFESCNLPNGRRCCIPIPQHSNAKYGHCFQIRFIRFLAGFVEPFP